MVPRNVVAVGFVMIAKKVALAVLNSILVFTARKQFALVVLISRTVWGFRVTVCVYRAPADLEGRKPVDTRKRRTRFLTTFPSEDTLRADLGDWINRIGVWSVEPIDITLYMINHI